ncbi:hypothetical protein RirG_005360 [Rhizophagus irregularis DAOM 197198w]|uniref:BED-type domain-containing protein n=1 Tax=Rhizophagus irregularis (strain DAOM 197198w) TaxID=1432141 RepID=A0A015JJR4_RHIIW|nr:hypothetical protein RirG_227910 [Rhizophagus irregularis DAOM 197198w]EXX77475.1 hypothetical protein RirG_023410 [Rhizophagus irregularis DAOM 197198w]EXX79459.1 hypothetical protein RirG_005360 [Rhizophagus irregularis DAOM 197198w]
MSLFNLDDAFISDIDDIEDGENNNISCKSSPLWSHITYKNPTHSVPVCKKCNYAFSIKSVIPKVKQTTLKFKCIDPWPVKEKSE